MDETFGISISMKMGIGWLAGVVFDPFWSIREMIRVTKPNGLVVVGLGSGGAGGVLLKDYRVPGLGYASQEENVRRITGALSRLRDDDLGKKRIATVIDFSDQPPTRQISIRVR